MGTLTRVFQQFKGGENQTPTTEEGQDILDAITAHFVESNKSRRQVAAKLKAMGLIQNTKEITRKPIRSRVQWSEDEIEALTRLYNEFKEAFDPVARIREHLGTKKSSRQVIDKIMDLGLCDDRKKIKKSGGTRRRRGEGDMDRSASESDSALEDSSSEDQGDDQDEEDEMENVEEGGGVKKSQQLVDLLKKLISPSRLDLSTDGIEVMAECLKWLKEVLGEEAEDREGGDDDDDDGAEDVPMVAVDSGVADVIRDNQDFKQLLKLIQMTPPANQQEQYWRIPSSLSATSLRAKEQALEKCLEIYRQTTAPKDPATAADSAESGDLMDKFDIGQDDADTMACVVGAEKLPPTSAISGGARKKKKEKRGPNKWMPMRRAVDEDLQRRLEEAIPAKSQMSNTTGETPKSQKKATRKLAEKKGRARKKKKQATNLFEKYDQKSDSDGPADQSDKENDESIIDKVVSQEVQSDDDETATPSANRSRKFLDSSDESDAAEATPSRETKRVKKSFLDSSSSDSDSSKMQAVTSGPKVDVANKGGKGLLDSSSDEEAKNPKGRAKNSKKKKSVQQKSILQSSSDSDEGSAAKKPNEESEDGHRSLLLEESSQSEKEESASKKKTALLSDSDDSSSIAEPLKAKKTSAIESEEEDEVSRAPKTSTQQSDSSEDAELKEGRSGRSSRMSLNSEAEIPKKESPKKFSQRSRSSSSSSRSSMSSRFSSRSTSPTHWVTATPTKLEGTTNDSTLLESASKNSNPGSTTKSSARKKKKRKMASSSSSENESMNVKSSPKSKNERKRSKVLSDDDDD